MKRPSLDSQATFHINRRRFLRTAAVASLPLWFVERQLAAASNTVQRLSPNDRPRIALVGCGAWDAVMP